MGLSLPCLPEHAHDLIAAITQVHVELRELRVEQWLPFTGLVGRARVGKRECNHTKVFFMGGEYTQYPPPVKEPLLARPR
jgi:hypothetical protein